MKFCPEMDIYVIVDGDEEDEAEAVGFAPRCAVTSIGVDGPGGVGIGFDEIVVLPNTANTTAKMMMSAVIKPLLIPLGALRLFVLCQCHFGLLIFSL